MMKFNLILILSWFCSIQVFAQRNISLAGVVQDEIGNPIEFANVYLNNSSFATTTDASGTFKIQVPIGFKVELIASFVGFQSKQLRLTADKNYNNLILVLKNNILNEVVVVAKRNNKRKRQFRIFEEALLGKTWQARQCEIMNPEEVVLSENPASDGLIAHSRSPLIIENKALGYRLRVNLMDFRTEGKEIYATSRQFFEELKPKNEKEKILWDRNREQTYTSSFKNYLVQLAENRIVESSIEIFEMKVEKKVFESRTSITDELFDGNLIKIAPDKFIRKIDENNFEYFTSKPHLVLLKEFRDSNSPYWDALFRHSQIVLPKRSFEFTSKGWVSNPNGLFIIGYWGNEALANLLPLNYLPEEKE